MNFVSIPLIVENNSQENELKTFLKDYSGYIDFEKITAFGVKE